MKTYLILYDKKTDKTDLAKYFITKEYKYFFDIDEVIESYCFLQCDEEDLTAIKCTFPYIKILR